MTYSEMKKAEAEFVAAISPQKKQRGATKAQLAYRAQRFGSCVYCCLPFSAHTIQMTLDCANARS